MIPEVENATIEKREDMIRIEVDGCLLEIFPGRISGDKKKRKMTRIGIRAEDMSLVQPDGTCTMWHIKPIFGEYEVGSKVHIDLERHVYAGE